MAMGVYEECLKNKKLAAKVLPPLIEFEFGFVGDDRPTLVQSKANEQQMIAIFEICKAHRWTTSNTLLYKGGNPYFRINAKGFQEIYTIAGPFADRLKNKWAQLILERSGKLGGYKGAEKPTEEKILTLLRKMPDKSWKIEEICLELRLLPGTIRSALRSLEKLGLVKRIKIGKSLFYKLAAG